MKKGQFNELIKKFESLGLVRSYILRSLDSNGDERSIDEDKQFRFEFWFDLTVEDLEAVDAMEKLEVVSCTAPHGILETDMDKSRDSYVFQGWLDANEADIDAAYEDYLQLYENFKANKDLWVAA